MTAQTYEKWSAPFRAHPRAQKALQKGNQILTAVTYGSYLALLAVAAVQKNPWFWRVLLIPAAAFFGVTIFRKVCNARRPYEVLDITPILGRHKAGQSFPSRHAFSIFMIAMAVGSMWSFGGILFLILGTLLAVVRVLGGVHFPRDVIAGAAAGIGIGVLGFWLL